MYRVRAVNGAYASSYSDSAVVTVSGLPHVVVLSPTAGQNLMPGDTVYIDWTAHLINQVEIKYSLDNGENWTTLNQTGGVMVGSADWLHFRWVVPNVSSETVKVWVHQYGEAGLGGYSDVFSIGATGDAHQRSRAFVPARTALRSSATFLLTSDARIGYDLAPGDRAALRVVRLDGSRVTDLPLASAPGRHVVTWDGTDAHGRKVGRGTYVLQLRRTH
jgi:hypothetical protein